MYEIYKYPRTAHIEGSGIQRGDDDLDVVPFRMLLQKHLVVEEKMDGANSAVSFAEDGQLLLQSRGHYLLGGEREKQFHLFKTWAHIYTAALWDLLGSRYIMYGEWLYAKHTVFYTDLPHYFLEFDIFDRVTGEFLSTERRQAMLALTPCVVSVKVLYVGQCASKQALTALLTHSHFISDDHLTLLRLLCVEKRLDPEQIFKETDSSPLMEGLYIKVEDEGVVIARYKYVRANFLQAVIDSGSHWLDRPQLANRLKAGTQLF